MIATNTIAQGDTKKVGLDNINENSSIFLAIPDLKWPGHANLTVSIVFVFHGAWGGQYSLNGSAVSSISSSLAETEENDAEPNFLKSNEGLSFQGSIVLGQGFVLDQASVDELIERDSKNADVIYRYLRGEDFTSDPEQKPKYWVINFFDWPLNRETAPSGYLGPVAEDYPGCLEIIASLVMPERTRRNSKGEYVLRKPLPQKWWIYSDKRPALYKAIKEKSRILFHSFTGKYVAFSFVPVGYVYAGPHNVFNLDKYSDFAILQSTLHQAWAWKHCSTLETRLRYANKNLFETFPFPAFTKHLDQIGEDYYSFRHSVMMKRQNGLTDSYNKFHNPEEQSSDFQELRNLHREMDEAVLAAYDWNDLDLNHGFHNVGYLPEKDRLRFTISEVARLEVLRRLTALNRQRYDEEVLQGLHGGTATRSPVRAPRGRRASSTDSAQPGFNFEEEMPATQHNTDPPATILKFLASRIAWYAKADILAATGITDGQWNAAIADLIATGRVERQGEKRGARYRVATEGTKE